MNYLDNLATYTLAATAKIAEQRIALRLARLNGDYGQEYIDNIVWWSQLLAGANDANQTEDLRLRLLTLLVDNARLNLINPVNSIFLTQPVTSQPGPSGAIWGSITGNINDQQDLIAKFNTYLPLAGGTMTGNVAFLPTLGLDVSAAGAFNIGATNATTINLGKAGVAINTGTIETGVWNATAIAIAKGGTGQAGLGTALQVLRTNAAANGTEWATITIPDVSGYLEKAGGTMTGPLLLNATRIDTSAAAALNLGTVTANAINLGKVGLTINTGTIATGVWQGTPIGLAYGGTGSSLSDPGADRIFGWDNTEGGADFFVMGTGLQYDTGGKILSVVGPFTGQTWGGNAISIAKGGTGQTAIGTALQVLRTNAAETGTEWATLTALTNPMTTLGDIIYGGVAGAATRLAGNTTTTPQVLISTGAAGVATAPVWGTLTAAMIPTIAQSQVSGLETALTNKLGTGLTDGYFFVGNAANAAVEVLMSQDGTLDNTGALTISNGVVTFAKMQDITFQTLVGRWSAGNGEPQEIAIGSGLTLSGSGVLSASGGGGTPGGSSGEMQWNNAGSFDGVAMLVTDGSDVWATATNFFIADDATSPFATVAFNIGSVTGPISWAFPDASDTFVGEAATQTLTNKTLTSPVIDVTSDATGDIYYRSAGGLFTRLGIGSTGEVLTVSGGGLPSWAAGGGGSGDVVGPASATDNAIARFDATTGKLIQNSAVTIADTTGAIAGALSIALGTASSATGQVILNNSTNANTLTLQAGATATSITYTLPTADGSSGQVLSTNGSGVLSFITPAGAGDMLLGTVQTVTAAKTFNNTTFLLRNAANTFSTTLATSATANRTWTIPEIAAAGTFAALEGTQTFTGTKTFSALVTGSAASNTFSASSVGSTVSTTASYSYGVGATIVGRMAYLSLGAGAYANVFEAWNGLTTTERFRIQYSTNQSFDLLGFGTASPNAKLHIVEITAGASNNQNAIARFTSAAKTYSSQNEVQSFIIDQAVTKTWSNAGLAWSVTNQREMLITAPTYVQSGFGGSLAITNAATLAISGAPVAGSGTITLTNSMALWVQAGLTRLDGNALIGATGASVGLYGVTPVARATTGISGATIAGSGGGNITENNTFGGYTVAQVVQALINLGILT
jgi:hypothetical protein